MKDKLLLAILFLLPWQTRWIFSSPMLHGGVWEYGVGSVYLVEVLILIAMIFVDLKKIMEVINPIKWPAGILFLVLCFSAMFGSDPTVSWGALIHLVCAGLLGVLIIASSLSQTKLASAFVVGLIPASILAWFQVLTGASPSSKWLGLAAHLAATPGVAVVETTAGRLLRAYGPFSHPNVFGGYLAVGILVLIWISTTKSSPFEGEGRRGCRWFAPCITAVLGATLVITFSRSAFLALLLGLAVLFIWYRPKLSFKKSGTLVGLVVGVLVSAVWFHGALLVRADATDRLEQVSIDERVSQYGQWWDVFKTSPLLGTGTSAYTKTLGDIFPSEPSFDLQPIHNAFLLFLAEQGIIGLAAFLFVIWSIAKSRGPSTRRVSTSSVGMTQNKLSTFYFLLSTFLPLALFDHYLWSSWAGLALVAMSLTTLLSLSKMVTSSTLNV